MSSQINKFSSLSVSTITFPSTPQIEFDFRAIGLMILIDGGNAIEWAYKTGDQDLAGKLYYTDQFISIENLDIDKLFIRSVDGVMCSLRIFAWQDKR